jgi:hypothetical protein
VVLQRDQQEKGSPMMRLPGYTALDPLDFRLKEQLDYLDFTDADYPFAINPFENPQPRTVQNMSAAANLLSSLFHELWSAGFGTPRLMEVLHAVTYTLLENPGSTLCEVGLLFANDTVRANIGGQRHQS